MYFLGCTMAHKNEKTHNGIYLQHRFIPQLMGNIVRVCVCLRVFLRQREREWSYIVYTRMPITSTAITLTVTLRFQTK